MKESTIDPVPIELNMSQITIYHNPRCSKSRQALQLLQKNGTEPEVVLYLETPLTPAKLKEVLKKLGIKARDLLRKSETAYKELGLKDATISDADLIKAMVQYPKLIERPIVVCDDQAIIARPPERVEDFL